MAEGCTESGATRGHLADRQSPCDPAVGRRNERLCRGAVGFPTGSAQGSACDQFPLRGAAFSSWPVSDTGVTFLRVHRDQIAEDEMEVHEGWRGLVLLRRAMASDAARRRSIHAANHRTWAGCCAIHDRQMVVLERSDWSAWLELTGNEAELLRALSAGSLNIEQVR